MSAYQRNSGARRTQRPSSFSGTRSRNIYGSSNPSQTFSYPYSGASWSPSSYTPSLTTYGGTASGYGGLTLPGPNSYQGLSYLNSYGRASSPSYASRTVNYSPTSVGSSVFDFVLKRPASTSSIASARSVGSEGYASGTGDRSGRSSRLGSATSLADEESPSNQGTTVPSENGELDYKKLYEETLLENERLREKLKKTEDDLTDCKLRLTDSSSSSTINKNSLSEIEKREKRAMERKLSEMEEELKQLQKLKAENERLRAENRALTRVVSKLTTSANAVK